MIASLPMYHCPQNAAAHAELWRHVARGLRQRGIDAPDALDNTLDPHAVWGHPQLVLSHICNLPLRRDFMGRVTVIGASDYGLEGCPPGHYRSLFVVRADHPARDLGDLDGAAMAYNSSCSHSGWGAPVELFRRLGLTFSHLPPAGSHRAAAAQVLAGAADFAAIDAQTLRDMRRHQPEVVGLRVVGATPSSPGMSFITRAGQDPAPYRAAIAAAIAALPGDIRDCLGLRGIVTLPGSDYDLPLPPDPAPFCPA